MNNKFNNTLALQKNFKRFFKKDFKDQPINRVDADLRSILGPLPEINWRINNTFSVSRARTVDETKEDISNPETFGSPPAAKTKQGRANLESHPVFYGGFDGRTAMQEIKVPKDTECYVSIWEFSEKTPITTIFLKKEEKLNDFSSLNDRLPIVPPVYLQGVYSNSSFKAAMKCRTELFTIDNYDLTAKIAHNIIYNNKAESQGLLYPSVIDPYRCNIALNPEFVKQNMRCVVVYKQIWTGAFVHRTLGRGVNENGKILWKKNSEWEFPDEIDRRFSGSNSPVNIHPNALKVLSE